ncbi:MAG: hypothetical protein AB198_02615 [Parcubacteria bacterium C7867-003]|nr:MAG: hypothetical protein AB198_02615 [Parcubacteria bacterium C7867-003]
MKLKLTLVFLAGLIIILLGYVYLNKNSNKIISSDSMTFTTFLAKGGSYKCDIKRIIDRGFSGDAKLAGIAYVSNGMLRVEYDRALYLIYKDKKTYNWRPEGNITGEEDFNGWIVEDTTYGPSTYQWDATMVTDFSCINWKADLDKFTPPKNIVFPSMVLPPSRSN